MEIQAYSDLFYLPYEKISQLLAYPKQTQQDIERIFRQLDTHDDNILSLKGYCYQKIYKSDMAMLIYNQILRRSPYHSVTLRRKFLLLNQQKSSQVQYFKKFIDLAMLLEPDNLQLQMVYQNYLHIDEVVDQNNNNSNNNIEQQLVLDKLARKINSIDSFIQSNQTKIVSFNIQQSRNIKQNQNQNITSCTSFNKNFKGILKSKSQFCDGSHTFKSQIEENSFDSNKIKNIDRKCKSIARKQVIFSMKPMQKTSGYSCSQISPDKQTQHQIMSMRKSSLKESNSINKSNQNQSKSVLKKVL